MQPQALLAPSAPGQDSPKLRCGLPFPKDVAYAASHALDPPVKHPQQAAPPPDSNRAGRQTAKYSLKVDEPVEFFSKSEGAWIPAKIIDVDMDTGKVKVTAKPGVWYDPIEQRKRIRCRTTPTSQQAEWLLAVLREGTVAEEAQKLFERFTAPAPMLGTPYLDCRHRLSYDLVGEVGKELDCLFGVSGSCVQLRRAFHVLNGKVPENEQTTSVMCADDFAQFFWNELWRLKAAYCEAVHREQLEPAAEAESPLLTYELVRALGRGTYGEVQLAQCRTTGMQRAIKQMKKGAVRGVDSGMLRAEINYLKRLDHPHIVKLYDHYEDETSFLLVLDFCSGGDLGNHIKACKRDGKLIKETFIHEVMEQICIALAHVHRLLLLHLDLKPDNIMLVSNSSRTLPPAMGVEAASQMLPMLDAPHVMIIDLGVAQFFRPGQSHGKPAGTPCFMAPEVWSGENTPKADAWSIGVVLFELLSFQLPFEIPCDSVATARAFWSHSREAAWAKMPSGRSPEALSLCRRLLVVDRRERFSMTQCLRSSFLQQVSEDAGGAHSGISLPEKFARRLLEAPARSKLYRSVALQIAQSWPANHHPSAKRAFLQLDIHRRGDIAKEQLCSALVRHGASPHVAKEAVRALDFDKNESVNWTEFLASCIDLGDKDLNSDLRRVFDIADEDSDGLLDRHDFARHLLSCTSCPEDAAGDAILEITNRDKSARVDWPIFRDYFRSASGVRRGQIDEIDNADEAILDEKAAQMGIVGRPALARIPANSTTQKVTHRNAVLPNLARAALGMPRQDELQKLADMGFANRQRCMEVLQNSANGFAGAVDILLREQQ